MELKPGYKQTEVGVIPEDWEVSTLGELCATSSGTTPARSLIDRYYRHGSVHWVKTLDLNNSEVLDTDELVTQKAIEETSLRVYPVGTVIVAMYGGFNQIGRTGLLRIPAAVNQAITAVQPRASKLLPEYLLATLNFKVPYWKAVASSSRKDPNITSQDIRAFPIAYPPLSEQEAIAKALSDADALIESLYQLVTKKRDIKQAAMQHLLTGRKRLPGFDCAGGQFKQSDVGLIPDDWQVKPLGSILKKARLGGNYPNQSLETGYPLMKMGNLARGQFDVSKVEYISAGITPHPTDRLRRGDILFNTRNTLDLVGKVAIWRDELPEAYYNSNLMRLEFDPREICSNEYANYAFNSASGISRLRALATGTTSVAAIYTRDLLQLPFIVPSLHEQCAIASVLSDIDAEVSALEQRREKTRALMQGMTQELLTGKTRLVDSPQAALITA